MNIKLALCGAVLLLGAAAASADPYNATRTIIIGQDAAPAGAAFCENLSPGFPTSCASGGLGAAFFDLSAFNAGTNPAQVSGSCTVGKIATNLGDVEFLCGSDLDDDTFIFGSDAFYFGSVASGTQSSSIPVCFPVDTAAGGSDWDEVVVFANTGAGLPHAGGLVYAQLDLGDSASAC